MLGVTLFDEAVQCAERRAFRTARRRLDRRQQRVQLIKELFAREISLVDPDFYIRLQESALFAEDKSRKNDINTLFNDRCFKDKDFHKRFPTVHHLIQYLINDYKEKPDIRLVYIACAWLVAHRGHFLSEISSDNIERLTDLQPLYTDFMKWFEDNGLLPPWNSSVTAQQIGEVYEGSSKVSERKALFTQLFFAGAKPKNDPENYPLSREQLLNLLSGGKVNIKSLILSDEFSDIGDSISLSDKGEELEKVLPLLGDYAELILAAKRIYDCILLKDILKGNSSISDAKVGIYETHKNDLKFLKHIVRKYLGDTEYNEVFKLNKKGLNNYTAYSYNIKTSKTDGGKVLERKADKADFCKYINGIVSKLQVDESDKAEFDDMLIRLSNSTFMPKQIDSDNRVIPMQLYCAELKKILENASKWYSFLNRCDEDGISVRDKIISVFEFRVPYYVGPLNKKSPYAWIERKAEGKIFPWNFDKLVDADKSELAFIQSMTNTCTYLPGEKVLPKASLLYCKYTVLNELNNLKINDRPLNVEIKQRIYHDLFEKRAKVTIKDISNYLLSNGCLTKNADGNIAEQLSGTDNTIRASLKSRYDFRNMLADNRLTEADVEKIIEHSTYTEDKGRFRKWLSKEYKLLSEDDLRYIGNLKYKDFGRISAALLEGIMGTCLETGEAGTVIEFLWSTTDNLMQIIASEKYDFKDKIKQFSEDYYATHSLTLNERLRDMLRKKYLLKWQGEQRRRKNIRELYQERKHLQSCTRR